MYVEIWDRSKYAVLIDFKMGRLNHNSKERIIKLKEEGYKPLEILWILESEGVELSRVGLWKFLQRYKQNQTLSTVAPQRKESVPMAVKCFGFYRYRIKAATRSQAFHSVHSVQTLHCSVLVCAHWKKKSQNVFFVNRLKSLKCQSMRFGLHTFWWTCHR